MVDLQFKCNSKKNSDTRGTFLYNGDTKHQERNDPNEPLQSYYHTRERRSTRNEKQRDEYS